MSDISRIIAEGSWCLIPSFYRFKHIQHLLSSISNVSSEGLLAWLFRLAASDGWVTWGRDNSSVSILYFPFDFEGWGLDITVSSVRKRGPHHSVKSRERSPSAPLDHVSFPRYIPHTPCWIQEGFILIWKTSHILNIDKNDSIFNRILGDRISLSHLASSQERLLFLSALVKALCTIWTCWLSNNMVSWSVFLWKCMAASTWRSDWG